MPSSPSLDADSLTSQRLAQVDLLAMKEDAAATRSCSRYTTGRSAANDPTEVCLRLAYVAWPCGSPGRDDPGQHAQCWQQAL